ncbi:MAG: acetylxylan esterase [Protaetiibacter sp.]
MHLKDYLDSLAADLTAAPLPGFTDEVELARWQRERRDLLRRAWNLPEFDARTPPSVLTAQVTEADGYRIERLAFEAEPGFVVTANIYVPHGLAEPAPAILYLCGHSPEQKLRYQEHVRRFAQLGFVAMVVDTIQHGEIPGSHHGLWDLGRFSWVSRGYSPVASEAWSALRAIDLLCARVDVDATRIGVTGISGGGAVTWWVAALDERVAAIASSSGTGTEQSHLAEHTLDMHCDCFFPNNPYGWPLLDTYLLVAPRPVLIVAAGHDHVFTTDSVALVRERLGVAYDRLDHADRLELLVTDSDHRYTPESRRTIFAWMLTHVAGVPTRPDDVDDLDGVRHAAEELLVLTEPDAVSEQTRFLTSHLDEWFVAPERSPRDDAALATALREVSFAFFPAFPPPLAVHVDHRYRRNDRRFTEFSFASEDPWRLRGQLRSDADGEIRGPVVVVLRDASDGQRLGAHALAEARNPGAAHAVVDVRGTGDTAWNPSLNWHLRRAARVLGRTIAGMQIFDALRAVEAVRELSGGCAVELAAQGDLAVVALVCGILDPGLTVVVRDSPASFAMAGAIDGSDHMVEVTDILRFTDIADMTRRLSAAGRFIALDGWTRER